MHDYPVLPPRCNFDTIMTAFTTIFVIFVGDDWNAIMYDHYRVIYEVSPTQANTCIVFFIIIFIAGNIILLNLFLGILFSNFDNQATKLEQLDEE
jgi:voltage-dependent calcium channel L type alpha-1D